jgi:hypothetical protein
MTAKAKDAISDVPSIIECCQDQAIFGQWFRKPETWKASFAFLSTLFGLPLTADQAAIVEQCTGRSVLPSKPFSESWLICGRRSSKSFMLALTAVWLATMRDYSPYLQPGEVPTIAILSVDTRSARTIYRYVCGLIRGTPLLASLLQGEPTMAALRLTNGVVIEIGVASHRSSRGYTYAAVLIDEIAFLPTGDAAEPDHSLLDAVRPGLSTIPGAMLLCASSPYAKRGALYDAFKKYYGTDDPDVLVWKAATRTMNPTVSAALVARELERDFQSASSEYLAEFRTDVGQAFDRELIEACVVKGRLVLDPSQIPNGIRPVAYCDPSGGRSDSAALCIAFRGKDNLIEVACLVERRPPFDPIQVAAEFADVLRSYSLREVTGDHYSAGFIIAAFAVSGITYRQSALNTSATYGEALGIFTSGRARLLSNERCISQLSSIERKTGTGIDRYDHPSGGHDDVAAACVGAMVLANSKARVVTSGTSIILCGNGPRDIPGSDTFTGYAGAGRQRAWDRVLAEERKASAAPGMPVYRWWE